MTQDEIIEMARRAGFIDYELDDGTTNAFDKRYKAFAKLVAEKAIKEALAQPEQEPAFWLNEQGQLCATKGFAERHSIGQKIIPLYTTPPQRKPLTDEEIAEVYEKCEWASGYVYWKEFARAIEAAHGIKE